MSDDRNDSQWAFENLPPKIRFNDYAPPQPTALVGTNHFYSNDPVIELTVMQRADRVAPVISALEWTDDPKPVFADAFKYAAYMGILKIFSATETEYNMLLPNTTAASIAPPQPSFKTVRERELQELPGKQHSICLFHLLVALEWWPPSPLYVQQLQWSFRRASDFLYDVTDGYMAFGQVIFAGPEYMRSADIQIYASSRLFPRSWVSGMYDSKKHAPIRIGRGLWSKNRRMIIPWDAPEAFRILVHEFAHYGLGLKDGYLKPHTAVLASDFGRLHARKERLIDLEDLNRPKQTEIRQAVEQGDHQTVEWCRLTVPSIALATESIMSVLEGTSELVPHLEDHSKSKQAGTKNGKLSEWAELRQRFPALKIPKDHSVEAGPGQLPLPLPEFGMIQDGSASIDALKQANANPSTTAPQKATITRPVLAGQQKEPATTLAAQSKDAWQIPAFDSDAQDQQIYPCIDPNYCWVYVLRGSFDYPQSLIAQGSLPARTREDEYELLGAGESDIVILIGSGYRSRPEDRDREEQTPIVLWSTLADARTTKPWKPASLTGFPIVDVCPEPNITSQRPYAIRVRVNSPGWQAYVFPFDELQCRHVQWDRSYKEAHGLMSEPISDLNALDGHVLLVGGSSDDPQIAIATYSIGGSPSSAFPPMPNPISAGSSEGNVMLFFYDPKLIDRDTTATDHSDKIVVTTLNHGIPLEAGFSPRSYTFSLAANKLLPPDLTPTLIMFYDRATARDAEDLLIFRQSDQGAWQPIPTYINAGASFAAAPLGGQDAASFAKNTAPHLFDRSAPDVERYRLLLAPQESSSLDNQTSRPSAQPELANSPA